MVLARERHELGVNAKCVALVLSTHMDVNGGSCFPSLTTLQGETSLGRTAVCAALDQLEQEGLIERVRSRPKPTRYRATSSRGELALVRVANPASSRGEHESDQESDHTSSARASARTKRGGARADGAHPDSTYLDQTGGVE